MVPPVVVLILAGEFGTALLLFFLAGASDGVDGFLAKRYGWQSELGALLDPAADKLLMVCSILALTAEGVLPAWLAAVIVLRDAIIVTGAAAYRHFIGRFQPSPSLISKLNTGVQILLILAALADRHWRLGVDLTPLFLLALGTALASGAGYIVQWARRARQAFHRPGS